MIAIVDYGLGNLSSIKNMFKYINVKNVKITSDKEYLNKADKIILPGVGSFDNGMKNLKKKNLIGLLNRRALEDKIPFLGICLGMQLMCRKSEKEKKKVWVGLMLMLLNLSLLKNIRFHIWDGTM